MKRAEAVLLFGFFAMTVPLLLPVVTAAQEACSDARRLVLLRPSLERNTEPAGYVVDEYSGKTRAVHHVWTPGGTLVIGTCVPAAAEDPLSGRMACPVERAARYERLVVMIDPGHGGEQPGAVANGIVEKNIVLEISKLIKKQLEAVPDVEVVMTRTGDEDIPLRRRVEMADEVGADLFISVHINAFTRPFMTGVETFFHSVEASSPEARRVVEYENSPAGLGRKKASDVLAFILQDMRRAENLRDSSRLAASIQQKLAGALPWRDKGVMQADFIVLRSNRRPSVLLELGFMTNPHDARLLSSRDNLEKIATAVRDGVLDFWKLLRKKSGLHAMGGEER
ncbi:MAG: N-acetylmuramoyl-L-alanine amidase [Deltaproteobacteria bacterium]|nr:MAG: N-acetylmuramoyl-L-alanine amidase [Deltaproteobacteria bacterium]